MVRKTEFELMVGLLLLVLIIVTGIDGEFLAFFLIGVIATLVIAMLTAMATFTQKMSICNSFPIPMVFIALTVLAIMEGHPPTSDELLRVIMIILGNFLPWTIAEAWSKT